MNSAPPDPSRFEDSITVELAPHELWELMWRPAGQYRWLGRGSRIDLRSRGRWALVDDAGTWRLARRVMVEPNKTVRMMLEPAPTWPDADASEATIRIAAAGDFESRVSIEEHGATERHRDEIDGFWRERLRRLKRLAEDIQRRRARARQAVVVIHGIGEQQPGNTLENLVASGVLGSGERQWVKPDRVSESYELRSVVQGASETCPTTDIYEFYWAHLIRDTTLGQIATWVRRLLWRRAVPRPLRPLWVLGWIVVVGAMAWLVAAAFGGHPARWLAAGTFVSVVIAILWRLVARPLAIGVIGDAARYLMPHPANVAARQAIREAGIGLIERLHASGRYDRIILLGHSLGSVIAYDIITHAWIQMHQSHRCPSKPSFGAVIKVEREIDLDEIDEAQKLQHGAWRQQRANTQPWLITDFVTVGSPLTYADYLMADDPAAFEKDKASRVLPTCPPTTEVEAKSGHRRATFNRSYVDPVAHKDRTFAYLHHGAPFAVTRWTNLYFKSRFFGMSGDLIGGPVAPRFGRWVNDIPLLVPKFGFAHTWYWRATKAKKEDGDAHLEVLRASVRLDAKKELLGILKAIPAFALLEEDEETDA